MPKKRSGNRWKITGDCVYTYGREERVEAAFESIIPEKTISIDSRKTEERCHCARQAWRNDTFLSELNDPEEQASRFRKQAESLACGDYEAMRYDDDYITALEYGLPPTAAEGMGIDRLTMLFTDYSSIRDVILFPLLRPST